MRAFSAALAQTPEAYPDHTAAILTGGIGFIAFFLLISICCCLIKYVKDKAIKQQLVQIGESGGIPEILAHESHPEMDLTAVLPMETHS